MSKNDEEGITNLGYVPIGMSYSQAIEHVKPLRKYNINPYNGGHRLTLCDTLRMSWREIDSLPDSEQKRQLYEYLGAAFDMAKRMDRRIKELKGTLKQGE